MSEQLTPTQRVKDNIAHNQAHYRLDMVDSHIALELATELERVKEDSKQWREAALQADELSNHLSDAITERDQLKRQVEGLRSELEEYRSIAEKIGAKKAVSERDQYRARNAELLKALKNACDEVREKGSDYSSEELCEQYLKVARQAIDEARE